MCNFASHHININPVNPDTPIQHINHCINTTVSVAIFTQNNQTHLSTIFQYQLLSCCVFSQEPITNHQSKVMEVMTDHNWTNNEGVKHFCACHPGPNSKLRKRDVENSSFAKSYRLLGVPTLVLIDSEGKTLKSTAKS